MPRKAKLGSDSHQKIAMDVLRQFRVVYGSVRQHFREIEEACGVSGSQLWILQEVSKAKGIGVSELALRLSIHQSTCSLIVEKLVKAGLIIKTRSIEDQRRVGLVLSAQAKAVLKKAPGPAEGVLPEALQALPEKALQTLNMHLAKLIEQLQSKDVRYAGRPLSDL